MKIGRKQGIICYYETVDSWDYLQKTLARFPGDREVDDALSRFLSPLVRYDRAHNSNLALTLFTFLEENGNIVATAEKLFLHRNSVLYRLRRAEEITGRDLRDRNVRRVLQLAQHLAKSVSQSP